jgi:HEAT repeat protein
MDLIMTKPKTPSSKMHNRKKAGMPLSKLPTMDAVRTVLDNPRHLEELLIMFEDMDRSVRGKAAAIIAHLAEARLARLAKISERLIECLSDDSAYVRWHLIYAMGQLGTHVPSCARAFPGQIIARLDDSNRIVRIIASKALLQIAALHPSIIEEFFSNLKRDIPPVIARCLHNAALKAGHKRTKA